MSKASDSTVQTTLGDLPTAEPAEEAETDAQSGDSEETAQAPDLSEIADDVGTTTAHQRERGDPVVADEGRADGLDRRAAEDLQLRRATVADCGINNRRGLRR